MQHSISTWASRYQGWLAGADSYLGFEVRREAKAISCLAATAVDVLIFPDVWHYESELQQASLMLLI